MHARRASASLSPAQVWYLHHTAAAVVAAAHRLPPPPEAGAFARGRLARVGGQRSAQDAHVLAARRARRRDAAAAGDGRRGRRRRRRRRRGPGPDGAHAVAEHADAVVIGLHPDRREGRVRLAAAGHPPPPPRRRRAAAAIHLLVHAKVCQVLVATGERPLDAAAPSPRPSPRRLRAQRQPPAPSPPPGPLFSTAQGDGRAVPRRSLPARRRPRADPRRMRGVVLAPPRLPQRRQDTLLLRPRRHGLPRRRHLRRAPVVVTEARRARQIAAAIR